MQNINAILKVGGTGTAWVTPFGAQVPLPVVTVGIKAALCLDLRGDDPAGSSDLPAYPIEQFAGAASWYFAIDNDYDRDTFPKLLQITGISVASVDGATILTAVVPNTAVPGLLEAVGKLKNVTLGAEIGWLDAEGDTIGCLGFDLTITNRRYLPGTIPEEVQNDPEYLTSAQALAHINAAVAAAVAALDVTGEPGPPPIIAVGTVQSGDTAAASLTPVPDTPGAYTLNLTFPRGEEGDAADAPVLTMGTVLSGGTAAATLTPVPDTPGAYTLSLTLPRGIDGSGITPLTGDWSADTIYSLRDALRHNGAWWYSKSEGNVGHAPPANRQSDAYWQLIVADGEDAEPVLMAFTPDPDEQSAWHLPPYTAGDTHYRFSLDGGATWGVTMPLSMPAASTVILFNTDAESDWADPVAVVGQSYSTVFGKYMRARRTGSTYGEPLAVHDQAPQELRVQFAAAPVSGQEPSWHAELQAGDDRVRIFNAAGSIGPSVFTFALDGLELDSVQFCAYEDPWHTSYVLGDRYRKFSMDGGLTFGQPIPLYGASAYEEWLAEGNIGTREDFLNSLKGVALPEGGAPGKVLIYGASGPAWGDLAEYTPVPPQVPPQVPPDEAATPKDLPEDTERRIWKFLRYDRPEDSRELAFFWQTSADGSSWGTLFSTSTHPEIAKSEVDGEPAQFVDAQGRAVLLPVYYIPMDNIHVRTCWGFCDDEGEWHRGEWAYRNTMGVTLSRYGDSIEAADRNSPEFFIVPIPDDVDHCEVHILGADGSIFGQPIYRSDRPSDRNFFFTGEDVLAYDEANSENFPVPVTDAAFEGQYFIFHRRGLGYNVRVVWTGDKPAVYYWHP